MACPVLFFLTKYVITLTYLNLLTDGRPDPVATELLGRAAGGDLLLAVYARPGLSPPSLSWPDPESGASSTV